MQVNRKFNNRIIICVFPLQQYSYISHQPLVIKTLLKKRGAVQKLKAPHLLITSSNSNDKKKTKKKELKREMEGVIQTTFLVDQWINYVNEESLTDYYTHRNVLHMPS